MSLRGLHLDATTSENEGQHSSEQQAKPPSEETDVHAGLSQRCGRRCRRVVDRRRHHGGRCAVGGEGLASQHLAIRTLDGDGDLLVLDQRHLDSLHLPGGHGDDLVVPSRRADVERRRRGGHVVGVGLGALHRRTGVVERHQRSAGAVDALDVGDGRLLDDDDRRRQCAALVREGLLEHVVGLLAVVSGDRDGDGPREGEHQLVVLGRRHHRREGPTIAGLGHELHLVAAHAVVQQDNRAGLPDLADRAGRGLGHDDVLRPTVRRVVVVVGLGTLADVVQERRLVGLVRPVELARRVRLGAVPVVQIALTAYVGGDDGHGARLLDGGLGHALQALGPLPRRLRRDVVPSGVAEVELLAELLGQGDHGGRLALVGVAEYLGARVHAVDRAGVGRRHRSEQRSQQDQRGEEEDRHGALDALHVLLVSLV